MSRYDVDERFVDAVMTPEGTLCVLSKHQTFREEGQYRYSIMNPGSRVWRKVSHYDSEGAIPILPPSMVHLDEETAESRVREYAGRWYDDLMELIRGWAE